MRAAKYLGLLIVVAGVLTAGSVKTPAQVSVNIGVAPECPYGYYEAPPYDCAPDGYYGPEWFTGGIFVGAGPWFHGPANFHGHVDHAFDYRKGYKGPHPERGAHPVEHRQEFHGTAMHDPHGNEAHGGGHPHK